MLESFWNHIVELYYNEDKNFIDLVLLDIVALCCGIIAGIIAMTI